MELAALFQAEPLLLVIFVGIMGLLVGSFLNVVIYRLPVMMENEWRQECEEFLELEITHVAPFNLMLPLSCCQKCKTQIRPWQNIPVISYLLLRGKCAKCKQTIALRYPLIEALTAICSVIISLHFEYGMELLLALLLTWALIALSFIDIDKQLLPDSITLPLIWLGLFISIFELYSNTVDSIIGAIAGYLSLWSVYQLFKLFTGKEGMGYGDFKLLAVFGAWLGWQFIPIIVLLSSIVGAVIGISMVIFSKHNRNVPIPFGPYLATAGWLALIWGEDINQMYLTAIGF